ncbi:hypothetical protein ACLBWT_18830 [Paenibacillus sp. D51F]
MDNEERIVAEINDGNVKWSVQLLHDILGARNWYRDQMNPEDWKELCTLLQDKLLTVRVVRLPIDAEIPDRYDPDYVATMSKLSHGRSTASNQLLDLLWITYKWLERNHRTVKHNRINTANFYLPDNDIYVRVGSGDPTQILVDMLTPGASYYHVPMSDNGFVYIIETTDAYNSSYYEHRKKQRDEALQQAVEKINFNFLKF